MTSERPSAPDAHPSDPAPDVSSVRLAGRWRVETWRSPAVGVALGLLTLPAAAMVLVSLLVLAAQGVATWLVVTGTSLVTTLLGALGATVALRNGHRGVVHRLAVLAGVWGVLVTVLAVVLALQLTSDERTAVAVLLVLGGTYTLVLALALGAAARVMPAPAGGAAPGEQTDEPTGPDVTTSTVDVVPTPAVAPDDDESADWPEWGANGVVATIDGPAARTPATPGDGTPRATSATSGATPDAASDPVVAPEAPDDTTGTAGTAAPQDSAARTTAARRRTAPAVVEILLPDDVVDAEVVEPTARPSRSTAPRGPVRESTRARTASSARTPRRRSATTSRASSAKRVPADDAPATEHIARQDGDDGPPTQRLPAVTD